MDLLWTHLARIDLRGLLTAGLDIAIVAFIIYRVLLLIRGTSAAYILIGLLAILGLFFGANQLGLASVSWLLDHLISYFIIILIIVFQADIRRGLSRMGRRMFTTSYINEDLRAVEEVIQASEAMARNRTGALIVLERDADLGEYIEPGMAIEARVSKALLINIFTPWPDNVLHDGAVLLKGGWLMQAGAVLPLSRNPGLDKDLGTRHRAAVGITEETDAIAVIVSEQRGSIGLCTGGLLHMGLSAAALRRELLALLSIADNHRWVWLERALKRFESWINSSNMRPVKRTPRGDSTLPGTTSPGGRPATQKDSTSTGRS